MENNQEKLEQNEVMNEKKKLKKPLIIFLVLLLIIGSGGGYYCYTKGYFNPVLKACGLEPHKHDEETETIDDGNDTENVSFVEESNKPENEILKFNGSWIIDDEENPIMIVFNYPEVHTGTLEGMLFESDNPNYEYMIYFGQDKNKGLNRPLVYYLDSYDGETAYLWIPEDNGAYTESIQIHRSESEVVEGNDQNGDSNNADNKPNNHSNTGNSQGGSSGPEEKKGHWETRTEVIPAWDEEVLVTAGYYEKVLVKEAWDEEDTYCYAWGQDQVEVYVCNTCGAQFSSGSAAYDHIDEVHGGGGGWHNDFVLVGDPYCKEYKTEYIHHDAVYEKVWHEPVYKTVHHPEETRTYQVWVED